MSDRDEIREGENEWSESPEGALDSADQTPDVSGQPPEISDQTPDTEMEIQDPRSKIRNWKIWLVPVLAILLSLAFGAFIRGMIGETARQEIDYGTRPFVPGESPHSTGPDSR